MSPEAASIIILCGLFVLLFLGIEVGIAMGIMAAIGLKFFVGASLGQFAFAAFDNLNSFTLTAVPLFVFMGALLSNTGSIAHLFRGSEKLLSGVPASLVGAVILSNGVFGAMSGSSLAATATFGKIAFPELEKLGYDKKISLGAIVVAGSLSVLLPPSIIMVVYGGWLSVSVSRLFAAGLIPGILLAVMLISTAVIMVKLKPSMAPKPQRYTLKERLKALIQIGPFLLVVLIVLGTVFTGIMTPTESAALGAFLSIIMALLYRKLTFKAFIDSVYATVSITAMLALVVVSAKMLSQVFQYLGSTESFAAILLGMNLGKYGTIIAICILYIILGCIFDAFSLLVLTLPFLIPVMTNLSLDLIWFGVIYVVVAEIGLITPPFGLNLFVLNSVLPQYNLIFIFRGALPFLIPLILLIIIMIAFPQVVMWLPNLLYG